MRILHLALCGALSAAVAACDAGKPPEKAAEAAGPPSAPPAPEPTESRYLADLGSRDYPAPATDPTEAVAIRFDFSGKRVYAFDFQQRMLTTMEMGAVPPATGPLEQLLNAEGSLLLKSKGTGRATLVLKDLKAKMTMLSGPGTADGSKEMSMPAMVVPDVKEDGSMEGGALSSQPFLNILFPMPPKPLAKGEAVDVPLRLPFNVMGSPLAVKGRARLTLTGFAIVEERTCARLEADIDVSQLDLPEEIETKASCSMKGRSIYYWDLDRKEFASGETAVLMKMRSEGPSPKLPGGAPPMPSTLKMGMVSDNRLRINRNAALAAREEEGK